jgi:anhydro-N-acetylmuramic acid kinase
MVILGLMSGTSLDGLDIAACKFWQDNKLWKFEILKADTIPYTKEEGLRLRNAFYLTGAELIHLHHQYGNEIGLKVKQFCDLHQIKPDYIASHGHTIFHQPQNGFTFQLGHGANIAARTGIKTICDFRTSDIAYSGQGAPLVPIGDELLFADYDYCLNLGGISNISFKENGKRIAFDICICNMALNELVQALNLNFDEDGKLAQSGKVNPVLLQQLLDAANINNKNKQSLGYEWFSNFMQPIIKNDPSLITDKLRTCCEFIAIQIAQYVKENSTILITGGGAKNKFLIHCIQEKTKAKIVLPEEQLIDFKEALIFAFLGMLRVQGKVNTLKVVTGASNDAIGGCIYLPMMNPI